jgi:DHA2 family multidrug resistance protein
VSSDTDRTKIPHHGLITVSLMLATTIQALDGTVANVALPRIQGALAATQEQMSWILTSYIVAAAVMIPLTGWLSGRIGRKKVLLASILGFTTSSVLCGLAQSLPQLVLFRLLQGASGAALVPMSQATLLDINPPERHARAMSIWVMGVTIGPIIGPALGAWLTENYSWRWVFYINLPIGILCFAGLLSFLPESPTRRSNFDLFGFATLSIAILALQLVLDRGQLLDWFSSTEICVELGCAVVAGYLFVVHSATTKEPFIDLRIFKDRNYVIGNIFIVVIGVLMFAPLALLPSLLQGLLNYPVLTAGWITAQRGVGTLAAQIMLPRLLRFVDGRIVIGAGFACTSVALWHMSGFFLQMNRSVIESSGLIQGFGIGLAYVPLATITFGTLSPQLRNEAAAFFSLLRNLGSSVGIAAVQAIFVRNTQILHSRLAEHVTPYSDQAAAPTADVHTTGALLAMNGRVTEQATMMSYNNVFYLMFIIGVLSLPLVLLFRKVKAAPGVPAVAAD